MAGNDVTTWADAYGVWHASVPATDDPKADRRKAHAAVNAELTARGPGHKYEVPIFLLTTKDGRRHYTER